MLNNKRKCVIHEISTIKEFLLIIEYIKRKRFIFCLSVTFGKPLSRKRLKHLLQKGKISNSTNWSNREAMKCTSACCFGWMSPTSRSAKNSPKVTDTHGSCLLRTIVLLTKARQGRKQDKVVPRCTVKLWTDVTTAESFNVKLLTLKTFAREIIKVKNKFDSVW